jgi:hypothetical protein
MRLHLRTGNAAPPLPFAAAGVLLIAMSLVACYTPAMYKRDVTAVIEGPNRVAVGQSVQLIARLDFSDGATWATQPSVNGSVDWVSSNPAVAAVVAATSGLTVNVGGVAGVTPGLVTGVTPGEVTITATPRASTTGVGQRIPGSFRITVTE